MTWLLKTFIKAGKLANAQTEPAFMNNTVRTLSRTSTTLPEVFRWHTSNLQLFEFPHFPQPSTVPPCLWLAPRGWGGGSFCFWVRDSLFRGEGGVVGDFDGFIGWIFKWGWSGERYGEEPTEVSFCVAVRKPLQEFIAVLSFLFSVLWAKTALSERYASLQFL